MKKPEKSVSFRVSFNFILFSDHSIFTIGSFGMWGSLLAGGDVIVSKGRNNPSITKATVTEDDEIFLRSAMPNWLYIDTRNIKNVTVLKVDPITNKYVLA